MKDPYFAYSKIASIFAKEDEPIVKGIHHTSVIGEGCSIDDTVDIGANVTIGNNVIVKRGTRIDSGCVIGNNCVIGEECHLWPNIVLYYDVQIGNKVVVHSIRIRKHPNIVTLWNAAACGEFGKGMGQYISETVANGELW